MDFEEVPDKDRVQIPSKVPQHQDRQQQQQRQELSFENAMLKTEIKRLASENFKLKRFHS